MLNTIERKQTFSTGNIFLFLLLVLTLVGCGMTAQADDPVVASANAEVTLDVQDMT